MTNTTVPSTEQETPRPDIITGEVVALLRQFDVIEAYLFGSVAHGDERPDSDLDLFVRFGHDFRLVEQLDLMVKLSRLTGRQVDLLTDIDPIFEPYITPTLVSIPL